MVSVPFSLEGVNMIDEAQEIMEWMDGFAKVAAANGVTDPPKVQQLMKLSWYLTAQAEDPKGFAAGFDAVVAEKQAAPVPSAAGSKLYHALKSVASKARTVGTLGVGGLAVGGAMVGGKAMREGLANGVEQEHTRDLIEGITRERSRPNVLGNQSLPYSTYR